jgi:hypothetical protein
VQLKGTFHRALLDRASRNRERLHVRTLAYLGVLRVRRVRAAAPVVRRGGHAPARCRRERTCERAQLLHRAVSSCRGRGDGSGAGGVR